MSEQYLCFLAGVLVGFLVVVGVREALRMVVFGVFLVGFSAQAGFYAMVSANLIDGDGHCLSVRL